MINIKAIDSLVCRLGGTLKSGVCLQVEIESKWMGDASINNKTWNEISRSISVLITSISIWRLLGKETHPMLLLAETVKFY